jgi:hypothetical protein
MLYGLDVASDGTAMILMPRAGCLILELTPENVTLVVRIDKRCNKLVVSFQNAFTHPWLAGHDQRVQLLGLDQWTSKATAVATTRLLSEGIGQP